MAKKFPHISPRSGQFPHLDGVDVWKWRNDFDYRRWQAQSTLTLCNVPFDAEFTNIVDWQTVENRDAVLDGLEHYTSKPLESNFRLDKNGYIKVPIPFDVADGANYLIVRNRQAATVGAIDYENDEGVRDLFFFILDCEQRAPNTTALTLKLDWWTTYFDRISLEAGYVERGHAPMWHAATPSEFLDSPIEKTDHLTAEDITVNSQGELVTWNRPTLLDHSEHFVCFALEYDLALIDGITPARKVDTPGVTAASYSGDFSENVGGYEWNLAADSTPEELRSRTTRDATNRPPLALAKNSPENPGAFIYGVQAETAFEFFEDLFAYQPHLAQNIEAVFLVPTKLLNIVKEAKLNGRRFVYVQAKNIAVNIDLTPDLFSYPEQYKDLTKLYTSPYAKLVLTDLFGSETEVEIQQCTSRLHVRLAATLLTGCTLRAELAGVGGATGEYSWNITTTGEAVNTVLESRAGSFFQEKQLPVYRLNLSAATRHDLDTAKGLEVERQRALNAYQAGQRAAGTALENTKAANETAYNNTVAAAQTARDNSQRAAATALQNSNRQANNSYTTGMRAADTQRANDLTHIATSRALNALGVAGMRSSRDIEVAFLDENNQQQREKATFQFNINRQNRSANLAQSADYQAQSLQNQQSGQAAKTAVSAAGGIAQGIVGGAMTGGPAGALIGGISAAFGAGVDMVNQGIDRNTASAETTLSIWNQTELAEIETETDRAKINNAVGPHGIGGLATDYSMNTQITKQRDLTVANMDRKLELDISQRNQGIEIQAAAADAVSQRGYNTTSANLADNQTTANNSAAATNATETANIAESYNNAVTTAAASRDTGNANAQRSFNTSTVNNKAALTLAGQAQQAGYDAAAMRPDIAITQTSGNGLIYDLRRDGFAVEIRTPNSDATAQLGDFFLRYGYAANRVYPMRQLSLYSKFTFWQTNEVLFKQETNAWVRQRVQEIFRAGVTVWRKIEDIGTLAIYDNERLAQ